MHLQTILHRVERHKGFGYGKVVFREAADGPVLEVAVRPRSNSRPRCSGCGQAGPGYDRLPERRSAFVPLWGLAVSFVYPPRRVACPRCGIKVERLPWAEGKSRLTTTYQWFLAAWAKRLAWQQVAEVFHTRWQSVYRSVQRAVAWGLAQRNRDGIEAIGVDEVPWQKGHRYLTLGYQIDGTSRRLLHIAPERTVRSLLSFFRMLGKTRSAALKFVCSDMWQPYLKVIAKKAGQAVHVLDRFHIMAKMNKAIDEVRAAETKRLKGDG
jgi:transposase